MRSRIIRLLYIVGVFIIYTSYKAIQLLPNTPFLAITLTILLFALILGGTFGYRAKPEIFNHSWYRALAWSGSIAMAVWATFMIISIPVDFVHIFVSLFQNFSGSYAIHPEKLSSLVQAIYLSIFGVSVGFVIIGFFMVVIGPRIKEVEVGAQDLSPSLEGFKIAQISDLHIGTTIRTGYAEQVVERTNAATPDIIVLTGDIADAHAESIREHLKPLAKLKARYGVFYVTGNHEYYWEPVALIAQMRELGFQVLINENAVIKVGESNLMVAGVTDHAGEYMLVGHKPNMPKALTSSERIAFKILLAHQPGVYKEAEPLGVDLQFSGHTHAGQFFPFSIFIGLAHKYNRGLYRHGRIWIHVNPGTGYWGPADRLGVGAEISLIKLRRS